MADMHAELCGTGWPPACGGGCCSIASCTAAAEFGAGTRPQPPGQLLVTAVQATPHSRATIWHLHDGSYCMACTADDTATHGHCALMELFQSCSGAQNKPWRLLRCPKGQAPAADLLDSCTWLELLQSLCAWHAGMSHRSSLRYWAWRQCGTTPSQPRAASTLCTGHAVSLITGACLCCRSALQNALMNLAPDMTLIASQPFCPGSTWL